MSRTRQESIAELVAMLIILLAFAAGVFVGRASAKREAAPLPTPAAEAAGEQHRTDTSDARSADPARRGIPTFFPAGSVVVSGARLERESTGAVFGISAHAAGREQI